ncbi:GNAT family N-acetyltransferase [Desulfoscipio sp. XC116]|uniref:GNAT family N-acetyltransferase n=1 Tax=Desulfoscipio sp. XC116 TaxID=3144975 RepID=UPI00325B6A76
MLTQSSTNNITKTENQAGFLSARKAAINIPMGNAVIEGPVAGIILSGMQLSKEMDSFRQPDVQLQSLVHIAGLPRGRVYIVHKGRTIVGYVTFHLPDTCSRWHDHPRIIEIGGIEVTREWRSCHVGGTLLKFVFRDEFWENFIVIGLESFRNWDLKGSHLNVWEYRDMMDRLVQQVSFNPCFTRMYDVLEHPANALIARCGVHVSLDDWLFFKQIAARPPRSQA